MHLQFIIFSFVGKISIQSFGYDSPATISNEEIFHEDFSRISEAFTSEILENLHEMFLQYYMQSNLKLYNIEFPVARFLKKCFPCTM